MANNNAMNGLRPTKTRVKKSHKEHQHFSEPRGLLALRSIKILIVWRDPNVFFAAASHWRTRQLAANL